MNKYKILSFLLSLIFLVSWICSADPLTDAEVKFAQGDFAAGEKIILKGIDATSDARARADLYILLARFSEERTGNISDAIRRWREVIELGYAKLPESDIIPADEIVRLQSFFDEYLKSKNLFTEAGTNTDDPAVLENRIRDLTVLLDKYGENPCLGQIYYLIGVNQMWLNKNREAVKAFDKALGLKPAISLEFPILTYRERSMRIWRSGVEAVVISFLLAIISIVIISLVIRNAVWKWIGKKHLFIACALPVTWLIVFFAVAWLFCHEGVPPPKSGFNVGTKVTSWFGGESGHYLNNIFYLGLIGVAGTYLAALGTAKFRSTVKAVTVTVLLSVALNIILMALYINLHYKETDTFERHGTGLFSAVLGNFYFQFEDGMEEGEEEEGE